MVVFPNSKINLGLNIISKRADGFHEIETCFFPVGLCDILEIKVAKDRTEFISSGIEIPGNVSDNLCVRAWELLRAEYKIPSVRIYLHKRIPIGAGLGGGSSDAAFMLKALNSCFNLQLSDEKLMAYASELGSDCSFFISNRTAIAKGRGEILTPWPVDLNPYKIFLVYPGIHISTSEAYSLISPQEPESRLETVLRTSPTVWCESLKNDFEESVFHQYPEINTIKDKLYKHGAVYASMSGSGSTVFGIFKGSVPTTISNHFESMFTWYEP
jgi:4-diphosphocytidyl-2-C-methyl-D-erythritol kinase